MKRGDRLTIIHAGLLLFAAAVVGRAVKVQILDGAEWAARARRQQFRSEALPAARGPILDAMGVTLVESRELTRLSVAPPDVRDMGALIRVLARAGAPTEALRPLRDARRKWVEIPASFAPADVAPALGMRGVHAKPVVDRVYARTGGIRRIVGRLDPHGNPLDGIELALDSLLRGDSARAPLARDREGRALGPAAVQPRPGATVTLTIHGALQDICERALAAAVDTLRASGGDIVVLNPYDGEVLALASRRTGSAVVNTSVTESFEPGSTLKPFFAAALIARGRARPAEMIQTYDGVLEIEGRTIHDIHKAASLSLTDVIRYSSNVGIVQFSERLTPREKYELLRDIGFGVPSGVPLPAEAAGTVREPQRWSKQTSASLAMGYEVAVTPLQLVAAYAALANGGELLEPQLIKQIRDADGQVLYESRPRVIRRVFPENAARVVRSMLLGVVEGGTALKADLANYKVGGKSGTARRVEVGRGYSPGRYTASFVGLFPGDDPQYVILVKLDDPQGVIYGGETAAPVTRVVLEAALAARDAALDRSQLATASRADVDSFLSVRRSGEDSSVATVSESTPIVARGGDTIPARDSPAVRTVSVSAPVPPGLPDAPSPQTHVFELPFRPRAEVNDSSPRVVPDLSGASPRRAVAMLHAAGFRVHLARGVAVAGAAAGGHSVVTPRPGTLLPRGSRVVLTVGQ